MTRDIQSTSAEFRYLRRILPVIARHVEANPRSEPEEFAQEVWKGISERHLEWLRTVHVWLMGELPALSRSQRDELDRDLCEETGVSLGSVEAPFLARVAEIVRAGRIHNESEYDILVNRATHLQEHPAFAQEYRDLDALIEEYETRVGVPSTDVEKVLLPMRRLVQLAAVLELHQSESLPHGYGVAEDKLSPEEEAWVREQMRTDAMFRRMVGYVQHEWLRAGKIVRGADRADGG
ncbi:MAG TPA: hypothetical protein VJU87_00060 [Gemmatimonadaceae bacterium]|nr:hypothetical protein [Gemmatimonadaceae bacterium]